MQRVFITLAITATILLGGSFEMSALAKQSNINILNLTINCNNGSVVKKQLGDIDIKTGPINVNCGTPIPGPPGPPGRDATITIITTNQTLPPLVK